MSITLRHHGKISDYRAKTLLEAKDKKEATQLRGIRGWLQNKLSPDSGLRNLFGITERERKLEGVWNELHKPRTNDATSNVNKIVTFHNLYNLMDKETKDNSVFRVNVANNALSGKKLEFIINDKPIASFKHFEKDEKTIRELNDGVISTVSTSKMLSHLRNLNLDDIYLYEVYSELFMKHHGEEQIGNIIDKIEEFIKRAVPVVENKIAKLRDLGLKEEKIDNKINGVEDNGYHKAFIEVDNQSEGEYSNFFRDNLFKAGVLPECITQELSKEDWNKGILFAKLYCGFKD